MFLPEFLHKKEKKDNQVLGRFIFVGPENDKSGVIMAELILHTLAVPLNITAFSKSSVWS